MTPLEPGSVQALALLDLAWSLAELSSRATAGRHDWQATYPEPLIISFYSSARSFRQPPAREHDRLVHRKIARFASSFRLWNLADHASLRDPRGFGRYAATVSGASQGSMARARRSTGPLFHPGRTGALQTCVGRHRSQLRPRALVGVSARGRRGLKLMLADPDRRRPHLRSRKAPRMGKAAWF